MSSSLLPIGSIIRYYEQPSTCDNIILTYIIGYNSNKNLYSVVDYIQRLPSKKIRVTRNDRITLISILNYAKHETILPLKDI